MLHHILRNIKNLIGNKEHSPETKCKIFLYDCEGWPISSQIKRRLEASKMLFYRRQVKIPQSKHVRNREVLEKNKKKIKKETVEITWIKREEK